MSIRTIPESRILDLITQFERELEELDRDARFYRDDGDPDLAYGCESAAQQLKDVISRLRTAIVS